MINRRSSKLSIWKMCTPGALLIVGINSNVMAGVESVNLEQVKQGLDTVWVLLGAFLVFFMQAGFGMVEAGFIRSKNTCNILTKNFLDFCMALLGFFLIGYGLMFGDGKIFVLDLKECIRIRTGEKGKKAIG
ncbi:MAG: P-II family nitrogen regulator [Sedimentisphaerales bacterium]